MSFERYNFYSSPDAGFYSRQKEKPQPLLTDEFALQVFAVSQHLDPDLPVASLVVYSDAKRELFAREIAKEMGMRKSYARKIPTSRQDEIIRNGEAIDILSQRLVRLGELPVAPPSWNEMFDSDSGLDVPHKKVLIEAIKGTLKVPNALYAHKWLDSISVVADLRALEAGDVSLDPSQTRTRLFLSKAF